MKVLDEEGIKLLVGSDAGIMYMPPGLSTHDEIGLMQQAGLAPLKILQAATINAARALEIDDQYGSVEIGKIADLVLVDTNPLIDLQRIGEPRAVIKSGQWISREEILYLKTAAENPSNLYISFGRLSEDLLTRRFH